jgi:hypothetical protein
VCALLDEELTGDEQCSGENESEHRGRELTGIIHRADFSIIGSHGERKSTTRGSSICQRNCRFFPTTVGLPRQ